MYGAGINITRQPRKSCAHGGKFTRVSGTKHWLNPGQRFLTTDLSEWYKSVHRMKNNRDHFEANEMTIRYEEKQSNAAVKGKSLVDI